MKKNSIFSKAILMALVAGMSFTSCSNDEIEGGSQGNLPKDNPEMSFTVGLDNSIVTRGTATTLANFEVENNTFDVWGYYSTDATGTGVTPGALYVGTSNTVGTVIKYDGAKWDYNNAADKKLWPAETGKLNFQAVSPAAYGTIINTPADAVAKLGMTITVPATVADQKDVVFGHAEKKTYTSNATVVPLAFEHALSQVVFQGKVNSTDLTATVKGVKICNVKSTADVGYLGARVIDNNGTPDDESDDVTTDRRALAVQNIGAAVESYPIGMAGGADVVLTTTTAADLCATNGALIMIPQSGATPWDPTAGNITAANAAGETYLEIECKIMYTESGEYVLGSADAYGKIYVPFTIDWAIGKKYTYLLNFGTGSGGYDESGEELMNYITFSVSAVESWDEIAGAEHTI